MSTAHCHATPGDTSCPPDATPDMQVKAAALTPEELEALWREAWRIARSACRITLSRLRQGAGRMFDADDFRQDAYLAFAALAGRWHAEVPRRSEAALYAMWRRVLWRGGRAILRRAPQRLWDHRLVGGVDLEDLEDAPDSSPNQALAAAVAQQLVAWEEHDARDPYAQAAVRAILEALPARQRQLLQWVIVDERPLAQVADLLGVENAEAVSHRLQRALAALRRETRRRGLLA